MHDRLRHYEAEATTQCIWPDNACLSHHADDLLTDVELESARRNLARASAALPADYTTHGMFELVIAGEESLIAFENLAPEHRDAAREAIAARVAAHLRAILDEAALWRLLAQDEDPPLTDQQAAGALQLAADLRASGARNVGELMDRVRESGAANLAEYRTQLADGAPA